MPRYPEELIEEIRSRNDIVAVIGARVKLTRKGAGYFACCPFHSEKTPSFSVSPGKQMYYCFGCGAGGNVISFLMNYENIGFQDALSELAGRAGIALPEREMTEKEKEAENARTRMLAMNGEAAKYYYYLLRDPAGRPGMEYFTRRGLDAQTMQRFGLGYASGAYDGLYKHLKKKGYQDEEIRNATLARFSEGKGPRDYFFNRVIFPIMDRASRVIGFGGRLLGSGEPKYLNSPETAVFDKGRNLYGLHLARSSRREYFLLCEGYMDVIALHQAGFDAAVATLGTALTASHAQLLQRLGRPVILCYDSDGAGMNAAMRAIPLLRRAGVACRVLDMRPYKDPDEFIVHEGAAAFEERIQKAENGFLFQSDVWKSRFVMEDPAQRTAFQRKLAEELTDFTEELERDNYTEAVCRRHGISAERLKGLINGVGNRRYESELTDLEPEQLGRDLPGRRPKGAGGLQAAAQILLAWAALEESGPEAVRNLLREEDMPEESYRRLYRDLLEAKEKGPLQPAAFSTLYVEEDAMSRLAAEVFSRSLNEDLPRAEKNRILSENLRRLRRASLKKALKEAGSAARTGELVKEMAEISKLTVTV